ncbi:hypothetical protein DTO169E5_8879 [Paecilomyces variotii]|nr:hypothetical protein DTO169E5_8879 [Paecilomyces variotii]
MEVAWSHEYFIHLISLRTGCSNRPRREKRTDSSRVQGSGCVGGLTRQTSALDDHLQTTDGQTLLRVLACPGTLRSLLAGLASQATPWRRFRSVPLSISSLRAVLYLRSPASPTSSSAANRSCRGFPGLLVSQLEVLSLPVASFPQPPLVVPHSLVPRAI